MPSQAFHIRAAAAGDLAQIRDIYAHYVLNGLVSFETSTPDLAEITRRWTAVGDHGYPYLVAEIDGRIGGYAYAVRFRERRPIAIRSRIRSMCRLIFSASALAAGCWAN